MDEEIHPAEERSARAVVGPPPFPNEELRRVSSTRLAKELAHRFGLLARKELELAREEGHIDVHRGKVTGILALLSGVALISALCCGLVAAILALGVLLSPVWIAIIGAGIFAAAGIGLGLVGVGEGRELRPERTLRQAEETMHMLREPVTP